MMRPPLAEYRNQTCSIGVLALAALLLGVSVNAAERAPQDFVLIVPPKPVPEITFETVQGTPASLQLFEGKVALVNVWATWCAPCRHEMPTLDRLQQRLGSLEFEVVALSIDRAGLKPVTKFYREIGVANLAIYVDRSMQAMRSLEVSVLPTTLLIGPDGREVGRLVGSAKWDSLEMQSYLKDWIARLMRNYRGENPPENVQQMEEKNR